MIDTKKYSVDFLQGIKIDTANEFTPPSKRQGEIEKLYNKLNDGDSFLIEDYDRANSVRAKMSVIAQRRNDGFKISVRTTDKGYRIFKVKK
jgi:hypothetical protein